MDQATHSVPAGFVWPTVGHPGRVPLWAVIPDPNQPRKHIDKDELNALASTMRKDNGGEQREIATVSELIEEEKILYAPARYKLVSGERRWRGAERAELPDFEIRVKAYKNSAERKKDVYMLNEGRVGLSDIENADAIADLMQESGWTTQEETARQLGKEVSWINQHLALLKLSPKARAAMSPELPPMDRLKRNVGIFLSRLSHETQDNFVERMPKNRATATQQLSWMRDQLRGTEQELEKPKFQPSILRRILGYYAKQTERRGRELVTNESFKHLLDNATLEQANDLLGGLQDAKFQVEQLVEWVIELSKEQERKLKEQAPGVRPKPPPEPKPAASQKPAAPPKPAPAAVKPTAAAFLEKRQELQSKPATVAPAAAARPPVPAAPRAAPKPELPPEPPRHAPRASNWARGVAKVVAAPSVISGNGKERTADYYDEGIGRIVTNNVSKVRYIQLWDRGLLKFQQQNKEKPDFLPTREQALANWDDYCS